MLFFKQQNAPCVCCTALLSKWLHWRPPFLLPHQRYIGSWSRPHGFGKETFVKFGPANQKKVGKINKFCIFCHLLYTFVKKKAKGNILNQWAHLKRRRRWYERRNKRLALLSSPLTLFSNVSKATLLSNQHTPPCALAFPATAWSSWSTHNDITIPSYSCVLNNVQIVIIIWAEIMIKYKAKQEGKQYVRSRCWMIHRQVPNHLIP